MLSKADDITLLSCANSTKLLSCVGFSGTRKLNFLDRFDPNLSLFPGHQDRVLDSRKRRYRRCRPWSARPTLFLIPSRLGAVRRREHLLEIEARCEKTTTGCWLYPAVREEGYPYIDVTGDDGGREQWSARALRVGPGERRYTGWRDHPWPLPAEGLRAA